MDKRSEAKPGLVQHWRESRRLKRQLTGDSPEKLAERHTPKRDWIDMWVWSGGVERQSRFKPANERAR